MASSRCRPEKIANQPRVLAQESRRYIAGQAILFKVFGMHLSKGSNWQFSRILRNAWMDLASATAFLAIWLCREHLDYDTLRGWLLWPVVFEMVASFTLIFAGILASMRIASIRYLALVLVALGYLASAWLIGDRAGMPQVILIAVWLLVARLLPPSGLRFGTQAHQKWIFRGAGLSFFMWGAGFVLMMMLAIVFSDPAVRDANGELSSTSPSWIFPLVWTPYFIASAILRGWRTPEPQQSREG